MIRRPPRSTRVRSSAASDVYKRQAEVAAVVAAARKRQAERLQTSPWRLNSDVPGVELRKHWPLAREGKQLIDHRVQANRLSARSADRVARLAWTVADLTGTETPGVL